MAERRFRGRSASSGIAIGPLARWAEPDLALEKTSADPNQEEAALRAAMSKAIADLEALADVATGDGADILAFQIEMLADPALIEKILADIGHGQPALLAWKRGLQEQVEDYEAADDDYFRARASDLSDLTDRVARALMGVAEVAPEFSDGAILLGSEVTPSQFLALDHNKLGGLALLSGSANSHASMLARARGIPMVVGLDPEAAEGADEGAEAILDADQGFLVVAPVPKARRDYKARISELAGQIRAAASTRHQPAVTKDGQSIDVLINLDDPEVISDDTLRAADGVGLLRTEFLFLGRPDLPDEEAQFQAYARLLDRLAGKPAIIRTLDIGGDKPLPGLQQANETNPFLGLRGIRFCLEHEALFRAQVRALLRAASGRPLKVMLPMVSIQAEIDRVKALFETCLRDLEDEGMEAELPPIGIMVETPAAAIAIDRLDAAFYSIGSNDLIQYVMAAARDASGTVANLLDPTHPAIIRLIRQVVTHANAVGREVGLCGDMASDPHMLPMLLHAGLRRISVAPAALNRVKAEIARIDLTKPLRSQP